MAQPSAQVLFLNMPSALGKAGARQKAQLHWHCFMRNLRGAKTELPRKRKLRSAHRPAALVARALFRSDMAHEGKAPRQHSCWNLRPTASPYAPLAVPVRKIKAACNVGSISREFPEVANASGSSHWYTRLFGLPLSGLYEAMDPLSFGTGWSRLESGWTLAR